MKKFFGAFAFICFLCTIGTVGAIEQDMIELGAGFIQALIFLSLFAFFTDRAGGFDYD